MVFGAHSKGRPEVSNLVTHVVRRRIHAGNVPHADWVRRGSFRQKDFAILEIPETEISGIFGQ